MHLTSVGRLIVAGWAAVMLGLLTFPPYIVEIGNYHYSVGHGPFWATEVNDEVLVQINVALLGVQITAVTIIGLALVIVFGRDVVRQRQAAFENSESAVEKLGASQATPPIKTGKDRSVESPRQNVWSTPKASESPPYTFAPKSKNEVAIVVVMTVITLGVLRACFVEPPTAQEALDRLDRSHQEGNR